MSEEQIQLLSYMKQLINAGKFKFQVREDINYMEEIAELGYTLSEALFIIKSLTVQSYFPGNKSKETLVFKKVTQNGLVYIKLKKERKRNEDIVICLSFHKDR